MATMGLLEDIIRTLERVPGWKRIAAMPEEMDALKKRIDALEAKLAPATGEQCPICKSPTLRVIASAPHKHFGAMGTKEDTLRCDACGHQEARLRD
jgi:uncharacterized protein with PIN domain